MCCIISGDPVEDSTGRLKTFNGQQRFQTSMMDAPCKDGCNTFLWYEAVRFDNCNSDNYDNDLMIKR